MQKKRSPENKFVKFLNEWKTQITAAIAAPFVAIGYLLNVLSQSGNDLLFANALWGIILFLLAAALSASCTLTAFGTLFAVKTERLKCDAHIADKIIHYSINIIMLGVAICLVMLAFYSFSLGANELSRVKPYEIHLTDGVARLVTGDGK
ncbi:hypothetical protein [Thioclava kandeliae]|uniref:Uncharacterized protein n=1 Tax=Thioclava kandeliae TaxID=3070818 RepID=A0ABV1SM68_9RHOB